MSAQIVEIAGFVILEKLEFLISARRARARKLKGDREDFIEPRTRIHSGRPNNVIYGKNFTAERPRLYMVLWEIIVVIPYRGFYRSCRISYSVIYH